MSSVSVTTYDTGDAVELTATFAIAGVATNPTTISISIKDPSGTVTTHTGTAGGLVNPSVGVWRWTEPPPLVEGTYWYRATASGAVVADEEGRFYVRHRQVA